MLSDSVFIHYRNLSQYFKRFFKSVSVRKKKFEILHSRVYQGHTRYMSQKKHIYVAATLTSLKVRGKSP